MTEKMIIYHCNVNGIKVSVSFKGNNNNMFGIDYWTLKVLINDSVYEHRLLTNQRVYKMRKLIELMGFKKIFEKEKTIDYVV